jgi:hypothetical protein
VGRRSLGSSTTNGGVGLVSLVLAALIVASVVFLWI